MSKVIKISRRLVATCQECGNQKWTVVVDRVRVESIIVLVCCKCHTEHKIEEVVR